MFESVRDIVILAVTITVVLCTVCVIVICIVCSFPHQACNQRRDSRLQSTQRDTQSRFGQDGEESGEVNGARDLSQAPPPAYRNANQYQNVDLEHTEIVRIKETYRISSHLEPETTSLPSDYTSQRLSISVAPQEIQAPEGQLPPTYSTAQLELMARRTATELGTLREENTEIHQTEFHIPSDSQTADSSNVQ